MRRAGFTLIEILIVIAVVAILMSLALVSNREDEKEVHVKAAAYELAAVLRETRERAIKSRQMYAVVFNIQNAPGSSGKVLNNRSGGHWYRVMGPNSGMQGWSFQVGSAPFFDRGRSAMAGMGGMPGAFAENPIRLHLESVEQAWIGDAHRLTKGKVRFLALTDQDNGSFRRPGDTYPATYPRPWFGTWDEATKRLHAWGGYDPDLALAQQTGGSAGDQGKHKARTVGGHPISHSGFFYEGYDGIITGSAHPSDRMVLDDTNGDGRIVIDPGKPDQSDDPTQRYPLWRAGEPRPLINASWQDHMLIFRPDGSVWSSWMRLRHEYAKEYDATGNLCYDPALNGTNADTPAPAGKFHLKEVGPFDLCNRIGVGDGYPGTFRRHPEASSWVSRSGFDYITLAPDVTHDNDRYPSADAYVRELSPCYRVGISPYGEVRVVRVRTTPPAGKLLDTTISGSGWNTKTTTDVFYQNGLLTNADGTPRGEPVIDAVIPEMLLQRTWWWQ